MREDLLNELEEEYEALRRQNEQKEAAHRDEIRIKHPEIQKLVLERENLIFGTVHKILEQKAEADFLTERMERINREIRKKLKEAELPEDYLAPIYQCANCRDTGYTGNPVREPCKCLTLAYQKKLRERIGLNEKGNETFECFDAKLIPDEINPETGITQRRQTLFVRDACEKWANEYPKSATRDLLLMGKSGLGKTFLMHCMANRLIERGKNVLILSAYTFLQMARKSYYESEVSVRELMETPVLMIDDLGSEPLMQNVTIEQLFHLINERQTRQLSTVISTNLTMAELQKRYTERVVSRLNNPKNCMILLLDGHDLRKLER